MVKEEVGCGRGDGVGVAAGVGEGNGVCVGLGDGEDAVRVNDQIMLQSLQVSIESLALTLQYHFPKLSWGV